MTLPSLEPGHFNHVALTTVDAERGAKFYCDVLGFRLVPRPSFSFDGRWLYRREAGVMIHLTDDSNHQARSGPLDTRGPHFAMQSTDIDRDLKLLASHGIETVERILPDRGYRQVFFCDPDGNVIELGEWPAVADMKLE